MAMATAEDGSRTYNKHIKEVYKAIAGYKRAQRAKDTREHIDGVQQQSFRSNLKVHGSDAASAVESANNQHSKVSTVPSSGGGRQAHRSWRLPLVVGC